MIWIEPALIGIMVTLLVALIGMKISKPAEVQHLEQIVELIPGQTDLDRKLISLADAKYYLETDEYQRLLTHCFRIRLNKDIPRTFVDVCDDFFLGFHTYAFDTEGRAAGDIFNEYGPPPTSECIEGSDLSSSEILIHPDQLNQFR